MNTLDMISVSVVTMILILFSMTAVLTYPVDTERDLVDKGQITDMYITAGLGDHYIIEINGTPYSVYKDVFYNNLTVGNNVTLYMCYSVNVFGLRFDGHYEVVKE